MLDALVEQLSPAKAITFEAISTAIESFEGFGNRSSEPGAVVLILGSTFVERRIQSANLQGFNPVDWEGFTSRIHQ